MAQIFKNAYSIDVGTSFVELYAPAGEVTWAIISGMTIANKKLNEILVDVRIIDSTNLVTAYLCVNSKLSVGSSLALAGDLQKIILKPGDSIEIKSNEVDSIDVYMNAIENDPSISYGGGPSFSIPWGGDTAFITAGDLNRTSVSTYVFSSQVATANIGTISVDREQAGGASDGTTGLMLGGYTGSSQVTVTNAFTYSSQVWAYSYSTLYTDTRLADAASNGIQWIMIGGYTGSAMNYAQKGDFASSTVATYWGSTRNSYYSGATGNSIYALQYSGYTADTYIDYFEHASQSNYSYWGNKRLSAYRVAAASNEEMALNHESDSTTTIVDMLLFASQGNTSQYGNLADSGYQFGAVSNGGEVLFTTSVSTNYSELIDFATGAATTRIEGLASFNGGHPVSESGD